MMTSANEFTRATAMKVTSQCDESIEERITMSDCNQMNQLPNGKAEVSRDI